MGCEQEWKLGGQQGPRTTWVRGLEAETRVSGG